MKDIVRRSHPLTFMLALSLASIGSIHAGAAAQRGNVFARSTDTIGTATMEADGTIVLDLRSVESGGMIAEGRFRYAPADRDYAMVARHVGRIPKGGSVFVRPFPPETSRTTASAGNRRVDGTCTARTVPHGAPLARWTGSCAGGLADGFGAVRMRVASGSTISGGDGTFAGFAEKGRPVSGIVMMDDGMLSPLSPVTGRTPPDIDPQAEAFELAYDNALAGAKAAMRAHRGSGNHASARYYARLHDRLARGRPE